MLNPLALSNKADWLEFGEVDLTNTLAKLGTAWTRLGMKFLWGCYLREPKIIAVCC